MFKTFMQSIATMEGFYKAGTRPNRNNNPGDLEFHPWQTKYNAVLEPGANGKPGRFARFKTVDDGFACMRALLSKPAVFEKDPKSADGLLRDTDGNRKIVPGSGYLGATVLEGLNEWAPPIENNVSAYMHGVQLLSGLAPSTIITAELL